MKKSVLFVLFAIAAIAISGCADVTHVEKCVTDVPYGFWSGLWHGLISFYSFFGRLFSDDIAIYAVNNSGRLYDFGFWLGVFFSYGGLTYSAKR